MSSEQPSGPREPQRPGVQLLAFSVEEYAQVRDVLETMAEEKLPAWEEFEPHLVRIVAEAGAVIFDQGEEWPNIGMLVRGYVELSTRDDRGQHWIMSIAEPGQLIGSLAALRPSRMGALLGMFAPYAPVRREFDEGVSVYTARALTDVSVLAVPYAVLEDMADRYPPWAGVFWRQVLLFAASKELRHREFLTLSPLERYQRFERDRGHLMELMPKRSIASLLGITPESLSRILARLARREE